jgi:hypothetical protein
MGLRTAFLHRPGIGSERAEADVSVHSLHDLVEMLGTAIDGPIAYEVRASPVDAATASDWRGWMAQSHLNDVLSTGIVREATLEQDGAVFRAVYTFRCRHDYERYLDEHAPRLRADGVARFGDRVHYARSAYRRLTTRR